MSKNRSLFAIAFASAGLLLLAYYLTNLLGGPFLGFALRGAAGLAIARMAAQYAALLAAAGLFVVAAMIAIPAALQPGSFVRRLLYVIPVFLLFVTLVCVGANLLGIGVAAGRNAGGPSFITTCVAIAGVLSTIAVAIAAARVNLGQTLARRAMLVMGITAVPSAVAWLGLAATVVFLLTNQSALNPGRGQFDQPGGQRQQGGAGDQNGGPPPGERQGRDFGPRGAGGPGGFAGPGNIANQFAIGGGLATVFAVVELASVAGALLAGRKVIAEPESASAVPAMPANDARQAGPALAAFAVVGVVVLGAMQLVPVAHDNPPVQTTVKWDSAQTQQLWNRACADCHSNETKWPWYSYIAPASWLTSVHIHDGREQFNISQPIRGEGANEAVQQIRNGQMPLQDYMLLHPEAQLTNSEKQQLEQGLQQSLGR